MKLTDFGLSRFFETRPPAPEDILGEDNIVTRSFCGTEQYMAPEMLLQQGHNFRMDWWSLGLLLHEIVASRHPFHGPTHYDTLRNMVTKQPNIDSRLSPEIREVIKQLLVNNQKARLCSRRGIAELKEMQFFCQLDWEGLMRKEIPMPFAPKISSSTDVSSFETMFTSELPLDSVSESTKDSTKAGGFFSFFGLGKGKGGKDSKLETDASFAGFTFTREEAVTDTSEHTDSQKSSVADPESTLSATNPVVSTSSAPFHTPAHTDTPATTSVPAPALNAVDTLSDAPIDAAPTASPTISTAVGSNPGLFSSASTISNDNQIITICAESEK